MVIVYDSFGNKKKITRLNCMANARRGFEKALDYDKLRAEFAMDMFQSYIILSDRPEKEICPRKKNTRLGFTSAK